MRFNVVHCLCLLGTTVALSPPARRDWVYALKESIPLPQGWNKVGLAPDFASIKLRIALPQHRYDELEEHLYEISDPSHGRYGQHLTLEEVQELVAPHPEHLDTVKNWLAAHELKDFSFSGASDWIHVTLPIREAEELLKTTYHIFEHEKTGDTLVRTLEYSLPEWLDAGQTETSDSHNVVFDKAKLKANIGDNAALVCDTNNITLSCLAELYNYQGYVPSAHKNSIGITGYLEQYANIADLEQFYAEQRPEAVGTSFKYFSVNGGENDQTPGTAGAEANLDVQFAFGGAWPINGTFWSTGGRPPFLNDSTTIDNTNEPYAEWLSFVLDSHDVPFSISTSYGDHEQTVPKDYAIRDGGVGDNNPNANHTCYTNDGTNTPRFRPLFPATCPFVTSVGGTVGFPEVAVSRFFSGGGFSDYFARPRYQDQVVGAYVDALPEGLYDGLYNPNGRGHPDVAAQSDRFRIYLNGVARSIGGTSASSPAVAAIIALLNDDGQGFNDVTEGHNSGCGTTGFNVTAGWDPVTGFGSLNFGLLKDLILH
ncbi:subtilisin-like protein [Flagelloscypha sp. PMI_526]|nr:subtilisin-like protein [Flagelloscypha sp. PMI_526]